MLIVLHLIDTVLSIFHTRGTRDLKLRIFTVTTGLLLVVRKRPLEGALDSWVLRLVTKAVTSLQQGLAD